jgi:hypothetical protein
VYKAAHEAGMCASLQLHTWCAFVETALVGQGGRKMGSDETTAESVQGERAKNCSHVVNEHDKLKVIQVVQYLPT